VALTTAALGSSGFCEAARADLRRGLLDIGIMIEIYAQN
jgi:hypothetical protein